MPNSADYDPTTDLKQLLHVDVPEIPFSRLLPALAAPNPRADAYPLRRRMVVGVALAAIVVRVAFVTRYVDGSQTTVSAKQILDKASTAIASKGLATESKP